MQTLRKPANWQDFESLCLLLWREEWKSEDIMKNGRNGQARKGVDIYGHREGENEYSGIQCKCKPGNKALTTNEIDAEIDNAKAFRPELKRLVFATTADKDALIEEYVRMKDDENRKAGIFTIDIKSWQDIVDILERNKPVLNTYLDIVAEDYAVSVTFGDGNEDIVIKPKYLRTYYMEPAHKVETHDKKSTVNEASNLTIGGFASQLRQMTAMTEMFRPVDVVKARIVRGQIETNQAFCPLEFRIVNQGRSPIDDYKIIFTFDIKQVSFVRDNVEKKLLLPELSYSRGVSNVILKDGAGVTMFGSSLIPGDSAVTDDFFVHVPVDTKEVNINWQLLSRYYSTDGRLRIIVEAEMEDDAKYSKEKVGLTWISDFIDVDIEDVSD